ncbi:MAG: hypothetical protein LBD23_13005 [Oscillospiraceae bacterium]|jgi:CII-binding regulator of phage lambda lysogenization HflD|nr:hypothetical protein [Oscillospiraceae bacterium]
MNKQARDKRREECNVVLELCNKESNSPYAIGLSGMVQKTIIPLLDIADKYEEDMNIFKQLADEITPVVNERDELKSEVEELKRQLSLFGEVINPLTQAVVGEVDDGDNGENSATNTVGNGGSSV